MDVLGASINDGGQFSLWVAQSPLAEQVMRALEQLVTTLNESSASNLVAGRDAALALFQWACDGECAAAASIFYACYERFCRALLPYM